jgi:hypothetical protein
LGFEAFERADGGVAITVGPENVRVVDGVTAAVTAGSGRAPDLDVCTRGETERSRCERA